LYLYQKATITRSSQPLVGFKQARSIQDEKLIEAVFSSNVPTGPNGETIYGSTAINLIIDARPMANAVGNVARGAGTENMDHYRNCKKNYVAIDNIHVMRDSLTKLSEGMCLLGLLFSFFIYNMLNTFFLGVDRDARDRRRSKPSWSTWTFRLVKAHRYID
jgi:hypothetical protein